MFEKVPFRVLLLCLVVGVLCTGNAYARGASNVYSTVHNLSTSGPSTNPANPAWLGVPGAYLEGVEDRICVFCHTPHGGELNTPLWNRNLSSLTGKAYTHYDSSTLSTYLKGISNRAVNTESLLCLSCHDGSIAVGDLINASNGTPDTALNFIQGTARIGATRVNIADTADLSDDHPISFSYSAVQAEKPAEFVDVASVNSDLHFFGGTDRLECGTCHDPHVDYIADPTYDPFLAMPNTGSAMCLSCHIK